METSLYSWQFSPAARRDKITPGDKADKKRIKQLEKELNRKEKALAETAALLVLKKSSMPIGGTADHAS